ncbi:MAG TPA: alkaline phosphatase family protein [Terriglobales bacterium]|nr:alkaline phosphatase family protein [Terriglobales bacterium]
MKSMLKTLALFALAAAGPDLTQAQISNFQHIVIIDQENRTPDNLFQGLCGTNRTLCPTPYDLQDYGTDNKGHMIPLTQVPLGSLYDPDHSHQGFVQMCDLDTTTNQCKVDGLSSTNCSTGRCSFDYVNPVDVAPYVTLAQQYGWANFMFQTNQGPSPAAHQFIFGGTSAPSADDDSAAIFVAEWRSAQGCLAPLNAIYKLVSPKSAPNEYNLVNNPLGTVCFTHDTMATLLDSHIPQLSWKYYTPGASSIWTAPNWIREICQPNSNYTLCAGPEWRSDVDLKPVDVLTDIGACNLRSVVWVIPTGQNSDHPGNGHTGGPSWVSSIVNKIGKSPCTDTVNGQKVTYWQDTAILITWDDWGGWYDHEPPTLLSVPGQGQGDYQYGFRVPLVVVSAYTALGYVNNDRQDFGSILRFIENNFGMAEGALNFADQRAATDLTGFFNFSQSPRTFTPIRAPLGEEFFLNDKRPMEPPDTD